MPEGFRGYHYESVLPLAAVLSDSAGLDSSLVAELSGKDFGASLSISVVEPVSPGPIRDLLRTYAYEGLPMEEWTKARERKYREEYRRESRSFLAAFPEAGGFLNWYDQTEVSVLGSSSRFGQFSRSVSYYRGGAHGMHGTDYFVLEAGTGRLVLADVLAQGGTELVRRKAAASLRKQYGGTGDEALSALGFFEDELPLPDEFYLSADGLVFHWNPYEIAPYVMGEIEARIVLAGDELTALTPLGRALVASLSAGAPSGADGGAPGAR